MSGAPTPSSPATSDRPKPGFAGVLRGIWLMTWRSQLIPRKLPTQMGVLLIIPLLIYITISSPETWRRDRVSFGKPDEFAHNFSRRLDRQHISIDLATNGAILRILTQEIEGARMNWAEHTETPEARQKRLKEYITDCYDRIMTRARTVLDDSQYAQFKDVEQSNLDNSLNRASEVLVPWGRTEPFYHWLFDFYFFIILPLTCVRSCGPLIRDELQADTLGFLITRPVGRAHLLIAKYVAQVMTLEVILLIETLLIFAAGAAKGVAPLGDLLMLVLAAQIFVVPTWSALGLLLGQLTSRYMAMALLYGAIVELGIGRIPTNINTLSITRHLQVLLNHNDELHHIYSWPSEGTAMAVAAVPVAAIFFLSMATLLFSLMEYHHAAEMQK